MYATAAGLWRWRRNTLRRATDLVEAWVAFVALLLLCLAAPLVGWFAGSAADARLQEDARLQQELRHRVVAEVLGAAAPGTGTAAVLPDPAAAADRQLRTPVEARWTAPDGTVRTGTLNASREVADPGDTFPVWVDARGGLVEPPLNAGTAREHAVLTGVGAATVTAVFVEGTRRLIVWRLVQQRYARLDQAWARTGPDWGRADTGG